MNGLFEILTNKFWMINPDFIHLSREVIEKNLNGHIALGYNRKTLNVFMSLNGDVTEGFVRAGDGKHMDSYETPEEPYINVMYVDGPITRNGGGCSYGSVDFRNIMKRESANGLCRGHVFVIDTPGGSAFAINDFKQGIAAAREKGQPVIAFVDGMCCSAGMYLASQCDERYYNHPKDQVGCIGVMAAFYTEKDGERNEYTGETYHELYDPESFEKNKEYRDIANEGDTSMLVDELARLGVEFREDVKAACPRATDTHLHGKVFDAEEVKGVLFNGQREFGDVVKRVSTLYRAAHKETENNQNKKTMDAKFKTLAALCGVESLEITEEGTYLNAPLLNSLNAAIGTMKAQSEECAKKNAEVNALTDQLNAVSEELKAKEQEVVAAAANLEKVNAEWGKALEEKQAEVDAAKVEVETAQAALATAQTDLAKAEGEKLDALAKVEEAEAQTAKADEAQETFDAFKADCEAQLKAVKAVHEEVITAKDKVIATLTANQKNAEEQTMLDTIAKAGGKEWFDCVCALTSHKHFANGRFEDTKSGKEVGESKTQYLLRKKREEYEAKRNK